MMPMVNSLKAFWRQERWRQRSILLLLFVGFMLSAFALWNERALLIDGGSGDPVAFAAVAEQRPGAGAVSGIRESLASSYRPLGTSRRRIVGIVQGVDDRDGVSAGSADGVLDGFGAVASSDVAGAADRLTDGFGLPVSRAANFIDRLGVSEPGGFIGSPTGSGEGSSGGGNGGPGPGGSDDGNPGGTVDPDGGIVPPVPEPTTWMMMIVGFIFCGYALRKRGTIHTVVKPMTDRYSAR